MELAQHNPWHAVSVGESAPNVVQAIMEIPKHTKAKYELDKDSGLLKLDRVLYSSMHYPANYGFIPQTYCDDHDPLDIVVLSQIAIAPLCLVTARVIGVMRMVDDGEGDDKIIAVAEGDMSVDHLHDIADVPKPILEEIKNFFEDYKKLEGKTVQVEGFENAKAAQTIVLKSIADYKALRASKA